MPTLKILWETIDSIQSKSIKCIIDIHTKRVLLDALHNFTPAYTEKNRSIIVLIVSLALVSFVIFLIGEYHRHTFHHCCALTL